MMSGIPSINFICNVLCLIMSIEMSIETEPPSAAKRSRTDSLMRRFPHLAAILSYTVTITDTVDITARYKSINLLFSKRSGILYFFRERILKTDDPVEGVFVL